jgi:hypothetical protein
MNLLPQMDTDETQIRNFICEHLCPSVAKKSALLLSLSLCLCGQARSATYEDRLLDAIHRQENSRHYPYGIKDGHRHTEAEAREIARRTVRHAWADYSLSASRAARDGERAGVRCSFIDFLADRYCPPACDAAGNRHWKRNLKLFLK